MFPKNAIEIAKAWARGMRKTRPTEPAPSKWSSPAHHIAVLDSTSCECGAEKKVGDYRCAPCARSVQK